MPMDEVYQFLLENRSGYLATVDAEGKPHARVIGLNFIDEGKLYYALATTKGMYEQIQHKADVELAVSAPDFSKVIRVRGKACIVDSLETKQKLFENSPALKGLYQSPENPIFAAMYIQPETVRIWSFTEDRTLQL